MTIINVLHDNICNVTECDLQDSAEERKKCTEKVQSVQ